MLLGVDACGQLAAFEARPRGAAHSMDTDWYAVDRDGHVAQMSSGEEGAVPWDAHRQYWDELFEDLAVARIETLGASPEPRVLLLKTTVHAIEPTDVPHLWNGVLQFASREYLEMFVAEYSYLEPRVLDGLAEALHVKELVRDGFDDYWAAGAIHTAYVLSHPVRPHAIGLFEYGCDFSGPYVRRAIPVAPLLFATLPPALQHKLGGLRMRLSFHTTPRLDPDDHGQCHHYHQ